MTDLGITGINDAALIASGGSALVYEATDELGREVAVKLLRGIRGDEVTRRFEREQSAADRLQEHDNIIDVFRSGISAAGEPFLIMPLFRRGSLADELADNGPFELSQAISDVATAAEAIEFAHKRGVLHRDLKPGNLLRADDGAVVVTDFGIARVLDAGISSATIGATTPLYAAPELLEDNEASEQSDVYSLGALLYALLSGAPAFADDTNIWATIGRILNDEPAPIESVPQPVMRTIVQAMAKQAPQRPATAHQFRQNLLDAAQAGPNWRPPIPGELTVEYAPTSNASAAATSPASSANPPTPEPTPSRSSAPTSESGPDRSGDPGDSGAGLPGLDVPVTRVAQPLSERRQLKVAAVLASVVLVLGAGWFALDQALGDDSGRDVATTSSSSSQQSTGSGDQLGDIGLANADLPAGPASDQDSDANATDTNNEPLAPSELTASSDEQAGTTNSDAANSSLGSGDGERLVSFNGDHFGANFPVGWSVARSDVDVGYGYRSQFVADDMYLNIDTTPAEQRQGATSIADSAREIANSISSASSVTTTTIGDLTMHSFTFRNNRGIDSIDIFFEVDGDGYAIVAGSPSQPETAFDIARRVALSIRSAT